MPSPVSPWLRVFRVLLGINVGLACFLVIYHVVNYEFGPALADLILSAFCFHMLRLLIRESQ